MRSSRYERAPLPLSRAQCAAAALMAWRLAISPLSRRPVSAAARSLDRTYAQRRLCMAMRPGSRARPPPHRGARANATHTIRERSHPQSLAAVLSMSCRAIASRLSCARAEASPEGRGPLSLSLSLSATALPAPSAFGCLRGRALPGVEDHVEGMLSIVAHSGSLRAPRSRRAGFLSAERGRARCPLNRRCAYYLCVCMVAQPWVVCLCAPPLKSMSPSFFFWSCRRAEARCGGAGSRSWFKADDGSYPLRRAPPRGGRDVVEVDGDDGKCPPMPARLLLLLPNFPLSRRWAEARRVPEVCLCPLEAPAPLRCVR